MNTAWTSPTSARPTTVVLLAIALLWVPVPRADAQADAAQVAPTGLVAMNFDHVIQKDDRILFVGDEITQQMFYTRAVAAAIISMRPEHNLRFYNGGYEGATAESAMKWIDDLLGLAKPTVVFVSFGLNDMTTPGTDEERAARYEASLGKLVEHIQGFGGVKRVIVMSPVPVLRPDDTQKNISPENLTLMAFSRAAERVALARKSAFIDLVEYTREVFVNSTLTPGPSLLLNNRQPSEVGHVVVASVILRGIGVTPEMLDPKGWAPLAPRNMQRVRKALAIQLKPVSLEANDISRYLYDSFRKFDERFFRMWRLAGRNPSSADRETLAPQAEEAWADVRAAALYYKK